MSRIDTKAIRARADAAPAGPWEVRGDRVWSEGCAVVGTLSASLRFIAAARTDVPALCARVDELESECGAHVAYITSADARIAELEAALREATTPVPSLDDAGAVIARCRAVLEGE